ncbi:MAG: hypothetical protein AAB551_01760 [Patescibacteria group bacterium]
MKKQTNANIAVATANVHQRNFVTCSELAERELERRPRQSGQEQS